MRKTLICAGLVLALFLAWPMVFGGAGSAVSAASRVPPKAAPAKRSKPKKLDCFPHYEQAYAACTAGDIGGCRMMAGYKWDVCEAEGTWPA